MSVPFDVEKDNARFIHLFKRVFTTTAILIYIYLAVLTYAILRNNPSSMQNWRGIVCIALTLLAFLIYFLQFRRNMKGHWPIPFWQGLALWGSLYLVIFLLTLINNSFVWDFYVVYSISFGLFSGSRLLLAVGAMALTMFAFQGLLVWPFSADSLVNIVSQTLTIFSITGFTMMFQRLVGERFKRNELFQQLTETNSDLEEAHRQLAQSMVQEQELAVLRERTRLAREMHDTIGHALVLISVKLEAAQKLRQRDPERCDQELESTKKIARETMTALRASIADLRSPALVHESIECALRRVTQELAARNNLQINYIFQAENDSFPQAIEETLWKVSQEAFTNIEKHAHASQVQVQLHQQNEKLLLQIHDDGIGLPPALSQKDRPLIDNIPAGHYGLRGIIERVAAIGGHLTLHSDKGQGTTLIIEIPLRALQKGINPANT